MQLGMCGHTTPRSISNNLAKRRRPLAAIWPGYRWSSAASESFSAASFPTASSNVSASTPESWCSSSVRFLAELWYYVLRNWSFVVEGQIPKLYWKCWKMKIYNCGKSRYKTVNLYIWINDEADMLSCRQAIATPFVAGALFLSPPYAYYSLIPGYIVGVCH